MASVNKVILVGNLGADPDTRYLPSGDAVSNIRLATTDRFKDKTSGEMKELTEWHRVSFFGRLAEIVNEYLKKGSSVYIEGRIRTRKYTDQSGVEKYATEIVAEQLQMLGGRASGDRASAPANAMTSTRMIVLGHPVALRLAENLLSLHRRRHHQAVAMAVVEVLQTWMTISVPTGLRTRSVVADLIPNVLTIAPV